MHIGQVCVCGVPQPRYGHSCTGAAPAGAAHGLQPRSGPPLWLHGPCEGLQVSAAEYCAKTCSFLDNLVLVLTSAMTAATTQQVWGCCSLLITAISIEEGPFVVVCSCTLRSFIFIWLPVPALCLCIQPATLLKCCKGTRDRGSA